MRRPPALLPLLGLLISVGACRRDQSVVVVAVIIDSNVPELHQLQVQAHLANGAVDDVLYFPTAPSVAAIGSGATFAVLLAASRDGIVDLAVQGLDVGATAVASGNTQATIVVGGRADAQVLLRRCPTPGCGVPGGQDGGRDAPSQDVVGQDAGTDATPQVTLATGLVARFKLDDGCANPAAVTTADVSGNGNDGIIIFDTPEWVTQGFPGARYANDCSLAFGGADGSGIEVQFDVKGFPRIDGPKSVAFWIRERGLTAPSQVVFEIRDNNDEDGWRVKIEIAYDGSQRTLVVSKRMNAPLIAAPWPASGWHHVAYTFDGTTHRLYEDGQPASNPTDVVSDPGSVVFGVLGDALFGLYGMMDEVRIYSRTLGADEVGRLFQGYE